MSEDDFESLLRWIERREPAYAEGLREHVAAARSEGYAAAREQAEKQAQSTGERWRRGIAQQVAEAIAGDIRAMQDGAGDCPSCEHESHSGMVCGDGLACLCVRSS